MAVRQFSRVLLAIVLAAMVLRARATKVDAARPDDGRESETPTMDVFSEKRLYPESYYTSRKSKILDKIALGKILRLLQKQGNSGLVQTKWKRSNDVRNEVINDVTDEAIFTVVLGDGQR